MKAIFAVMNTTRVVVKIRLEKKSQACTGFVPTTFAIPVHNDQLPISLLAQLVAYGREEPV